MKVTVQKSAARGCVKAPPSKSMAHRLLIAAAFCRGQSVVHNISLSEDIKATISCLESLGIECHYEDGSVYVNGGKLTKAKDTLFCNESGSTLRFFVPVALLLGEPVKFVGSEKLFSRPLDEYEKICRENGFEFTKCKDSLTVCGRLSAGRYSVMGNISSQYITGLVFALSLLDEDSVIDITPPVSSRSYIDLTIGALAQFGVQVYWQDDHTLYISAKDKYTPREVTVEGDCSNAAFLEAFNLIGGDVRVTGLLKETIQGDRVYREMFPQLAQGAPTLHIDDCPDLAPVLFTMASMLGGATFYGTQRLKIKESDRAAVMASELSKFGADIEVHDDYVVVKKAQLHTPVQELYGHNDHRIVMSLALISSVYGGSIDGAEAVKKSFPDFFEVIETLGIKFSKEQK